MPIKPPANEGRPGRYIRRSLSAPALNETANQKVEGWMDEGHEAGKQGGRGGREEGKKRRL